MLSGHNLCFLAVASASHAATATVTATAGLAFLAITDHVHHDPDDQHGQDTHNQNVASISLNPLQHSFLLSVTYTQRRIVA